MDGDERTCTIVQRRYGCGPSGRPGGPRERPVTWAHVRATFAYGRSRWRSGAKAGLRVALLL